MYVSSIASVAISAGLVAARAHGQQSQSAHLLTDIDEISKHWGQVSPYRDNKPWQFGVSHVGMPDGCQVEQVHLLQRHANRFPTGAPDDGQNDERFAIKLANYTAGTQGGFTGPLEFLNSYRYVMSTGLLTGLGASTEFASGVQFWNRYGRTLYNATVGQVSYDASKATKRGRPTLRTTDQSRIWNSQINWALGFFGPSYQAVPNPTFENVTAPFDVVYIHEGGTENNTLASYDSCPNDNIDTIGYIGDADVFNYIPRYLKAATARLQAYVPKNFKLNTNDTYAMQSICAYETGYIGNSDFCQLFTADEWAGFENTLDMEYFYDYSYGNPTGRAQGLGYVQELVARIKGQYITSSNSSVNSSITNNPKDFPLGKPFYADFSHDDIIVSALTALSIDYYRDPPSLKDYPPNPNRHFILSHLTPFGARLTTEVIGCNSANPTSKAKYAEHYYPEQYGYNAKTATHKFIRMRLNNGIVPLASMRGGKCKGRNDGLCGVEGFLQGWTEQEKLARYQEACFGNYTLSAEEGMQGRDFDGTVPK